ncbi:hypothetical protein AB0B89_36540 [Sphaerisporangium sp. NPDC049002]|uniref:hypothetical protein n=1 Tax=Sphaerisporangium sp. NPDC049002 TaxID=3155392 RepID=UPI0033E2EB1C
MANARERAKDRKAVRRAWHMQRINAAATPAGRIRFATDYLLATLRTANEDKVLEIATTVTKYLIDTSDSIPTPTRSNA